MPPTTEQLDLLAFAQRHLATRQAERAVVATKKDTAERYFWPEQTPQERAAMTQFLVDIGEATWFHKEPPRV